MDRQAVGTSRPPASQDDSNLQQERGSTQDASPEPEAGTGMTQLPAWPGLAQTQGSGHLAPLPHPAHLQKPDSCS